MSRTPEQTYDAAGRRALPVLTAGGSLFLLVMGAEHLVLLSGTARLVASTTDAAGAVLLALVHVVTRYRFGDDRFGQPLASAVLLVVVGCSVTAVVVTDQPRQSSGVLLAVVAAGICLPSPRWLLATLYLAWGGWAAGALLAGADVVGGRSQWEHWSVALTAASVTAGVVGYALRQGLRALASAHSESDAAAVRDQLTGLANRRGLAMVGSQIVEHARRQGDAVHCIFIDVDGLRPVNDALGHTAGDDVLSAVADALRVVTRSADVVARWGGDEFCVVGPGPGMAPLELERRVRDNLLRRPPVPEAAWSPGVSAGGSMLAPWDSGTLDTLLGKADQEMCVRRSLRREGGASPSPRTAPAE